MRHVLRPQLRLPFGSHDKTRTPEYLVCGGRPVALEFVRHARARRYVIRVTSDGRVRVTLPRWGRKADARRFAQTQTDWIVRQRAARLIAQTAATAPLEPGAEVLLYGQSHVTIFESDERHTRVQVGDLTAVGPPGTAFPVLLARALRHAARRLTIPRLLELAGQHGLEVSAVSIRNQRTRWGSCSPTGRISLNWRLVQMPPAVSDYILLHELMHLRVPNHSRRFWKQVEAVCPEYRDARRWLREHGKSLL